LNDRREEEYKKQIESLIVLNETLLKRLFPDKTIEEGDLNEDTYSEAFIVMNFEKILQRIRMLMKESFFYKKDVLLRKIRSPKEYPYIQIYAALTKLIDDENEFIADFIFAHPPAGKVVSRVILSPSHAKRLAKALTENVAIYEGKFGAIKESGEPPKFGINLGNN
jgi:hypothetical protein